MQITTGTVSQYLDGNDTFQRVPWQITDGTDTLQEGVQSFPLTASVEDVKAFLSQTLQVYQEDAARYAEASARQADLDAAAQAADELSSITITA